MCVCTCGLPIDCDETRCAICADDLPAAQLGFTGLNEADYQTKESER
jgi:hypothetical protein